MFSPLRFFACPSPSTRLPSSASQAALKRTETDAPGGENVETIAVCIPMTSRGTVMNTTYDSPVWTHAFSTFLSNTDWTAPKFRFHW